MYAEKAEVNQKYLNKYGTPVKMIGLKGNKVILEVDVSGNKVEVAKDYYLKPYRDSELNKEAKALLKANGNGKKNGHREGSLSSLIDPMLLAGDHTVKEIADQLAKKAASLVKGKDLEANVRARMVTYTRKGWRVQKDDQKRVKVVQSKG